MIKAAGAEETIQMTTHNDLEKVIYCCVSVDGDLRLGTPNQQMQAVHAMRQVHASLNILGSTNWLINEQDFRWTELHPELLLELAASRECIGIHDHLDTQHLEDKSSDKIFEFISISKRRICDFYDRYGLDIPIVVHRNGGAQQGREIYRALERMEYSICSDVWPGMKWYSRMIPIQHPVQHWKALETEDSDSVFTDNSRVPLIANPWRHDAENWLDVNSQIGRFLQVPITCLPWVDQSRVQSAVENSQRQVFLVLDTHPYNLQDSETGNVSNELVNNFINSIAWIRDTYDAKFIRIDQIPKLITFQPEIKTRE